MANTDAILRSKVDSAEVRPSSSGRVDTDPLGRESGLLYEKLTLLRRQHHDREHHRPFVMVTFKQAERNVLTDGKAQKDLM